MNRQVAKNAKIFSNAFHYTRQKRTGIPLITFVVGTVLVLLLAGCGGLGGEPVIVATLPPATAIADAPTTPPDLARGAELYAQNCTRCHGTSGAGDGELIGTGEGQVPTRPRSFLDAVTTAEQTPLDWYLTITNGNLDVLMPPWKDALPEADRWAVALYTYTLHYTQDDLAAGAAVTAGDPVLPADLPDAFGQVRVTDAELITQAGLPAPFVSSLSDEQREQLAAYLRSLTVMNSQQMGVIAVTPVVTPEPVTTPEATAEATQAVGTGTVTGMVTNGTAGAALEGEMKANLYAITAQGVTAPTETTVGADGRFAFANVDLRADEQYLVTVTYKGRGYGSERKNGDATLNALDLPVTVYETTGDTSVLSISAWVSQVQVVRGYLEVTDFIQVANSSDRAYSTEQMVDAIRYAGLQVPVPDGAQILSADVRNARYAMGADGKSVIDTAPVLPGTQHIFQMVYRLPYQGEVTVEQRMPYPFSGSFRLLLATPTASVSSDVLPSIGPQTLSGATFQGYGGALNLAAGGSIRYTVSGGIEGNTGSASVVSSDKLVPLLLILAGVIAVIAALVLQFGRNRKLSVQTSADGSDKLIDGLVAQIAELDTSYHAGTVDEATYQKRRERLKARLATLIDEDSQ
ncbi:MAG: cytochrome c [Chloroflexi bacterium]|nr:cytochrome c [Chloroflexota bacterium]